MARYAKGDKRRRNTFVHAAWLSEEEREAYAALTRRMDERLAAVRTLWRQRDALKQRAYRRMKKAAHAPQF